MPALIQAIYACLANIGTPPAREELAEPAVPVKKSIKPDTVIRLECGTPKKMLKRHLQSDHGMTADEYRAKWHLLTDYPVVASNYAAPRSAMAKMIGFGRKPARAKRGRAAA